MIINFTTFKIASCSAKQGRKGSKRVNPVIKARFPCMLPVLLCLSWQCNLFQLFYVTNWTKIGVPYFRE